MPKSLSLSALGREHAPERDLSRLRHYPHGFLRAFEHAQHDFVLRDEDRAEVPDDLVRPPALALDPPVELFHVRRLHIGPKAFDDELCLAIGTHGLQVAARGQVLKAGKPYG